MTTNKSQWKKRVEITQYFYTCLISNFNDAEILQQSHNYEFEANQYKIIEYFSQFKDEIIETFSKHIKQNWDWKRLSLTTQAILLQAYCEYKVNNLPKAIIIDQALITTERYIGNDSKSFINGILDKVVK